jgi:tetratricopeptide (TPR) repeat protein
MRLLLLLLLALPAALAGSPSGGDNPFIDKHLYAAERALEAGDVDKARHAVERALERDDQHLGALLMWATVAEASKDKDTAAYALHAWLTLVEAAADKPASKKEVKAIRERLAAIDLDAEAFRDLTGDYVKELRKLEKSHSSRGRLHSAIALLEEVLHIVPRDREALARLKEIRRTGGADVATEDMYAGSDPSLGADAEWIAEFDAEHSTWKGKASEETDNYVIHTDAGYLVLKTAAIAMEQMNGAYRVFFRYMEDGGPTPQIDVNIFQDRDEYLELGKGPPVEWSAGHFTGDSVETYAPGSSGESNLLGMYHTLFHEAAHQFVSLTGRGGVPGWLNEAYASFFEGTVLLSNGTVRWNQVNTGRLFALAPRMDRGWMADHADGVRGADGDWGTPEKAPTLRILIENEYGWGPPWYAPTWGVVYFLYNYRDDATGKAIFRDPLHEYYLSGAAHKSCCRARTRRWRRSMS